MSRTETDTIGSRDLPDNVRHGIHTLRALENFPLLGQDLVESLVDDSNLLGQGGVEITVGDARWKHNEERIYQWRFTIYNRSHSGARQEPQHPTRIHSKE